MQLLAGRTKNGVTIYNSAWYPPETRYVGWEYWARHEGRVFTIVLDVDCYTLTVGDELKMVMATASSDSKLRKYAATLGLEVL